MGFPLPLPSSDLKLPNVRLSAAKVRFAQSKFSDVQTQRRERKEGKRVVKINKFQGHVLISRVCACKRE